jgi:hypothetical protein
MLAAWTSIPRNEWDEHWDKKTLIKWALASREYFAGVRPSPLPNIVYKCLTQSGKTLNALREIAFLSRMNADFGYTAIAVAIRVVSTNAATMRQWAIAARDYFEKNQVNFDVYCISSFDVHNSIDQAKLAMLTTRPKCLIVMSNPAQDAKINDYKEFGASKKIFVRIYHDEADQTFTQRCPKQSNGGDYLMSATTNDKMNHLVSENAVAGVMTVKAEYKGFKDCQFRACGKVKGENKNARFERTLEDPHFRRTIMTMSGVEVTPMIKGDLEKSNKSQLACVLRLVAKNFVVFWDYQRGLWLYVPGQEPELIMSPKTPGDRPMNVVISDLISARNLRAVGGYAAVIYASGDKGGRGETIHDSGMRADGNHTRGNVLTDLVGDESSNEETTEQRIGRINGNVGSAPDYPVTGPFVHLPLQKTWDLLLGKEAETHLFNSGDIHEPNYKKRTIEVQRAVKRLRPEHVECYEQHWTHYATLEELCAAHPSIHTDITRDDRGFIKGSITKEKVLHFSEVEAFQTGGKVTAQIPTRNMKVGESRVRKYISYRDLADINSAVFSIKELRKVR